MGKTWDYVIQLVDYDESQDEIGNAVLNKVKRSVYAIRKSVARREFYLAGQAGITIDESFIIHPYEYHGETAIEFDGNTLTILRTYQINSEELEIICQLKGRDIK